MYYVDDPATIHFSSGECIVSIDYSTILHDGSLNILNNGFISYLLCDTCLSPFLMIMHVSFPSLLLTYKCIVSRMC